MERDGEHKYDIPCEGERVNLCYYRMESTVCRKTGGPNPLRTIIRILSLLFPESVLKLPWHVDKEEGKASKFQLNSRSRGRLQQ